MKKIIYVFTMCMSLSTVFNSCSDDGDDKNLLAPAGAADNLAFTDTDSGVQTIGGTLSWQLPSQEVNIDGYVIYLGHSNTSKDVKLGEVSKGTVSFAVPAGTAFNAYLLVVARNASGESTNIASVAVIDLQPEPEPEAPRTLGVFILNRGAYEANNASLSYYNLSEKLMIPNLYKSVNGKGLGDSAEQILIYGSKMYITVTTSNLLLVLDGTGTELKRIEPAGNNKEPLRPRRLAAYNGKVYVSYYYGHTVAALDTASLDIGKTVSVGRYPEALAVAGGKLYVANSGGLDFPNYGHTVSVIDPESFTVEKAIEVALNPTRLTADSQGDVYVISMGNYADVPNTLQRIDAATGKVSSMGNGSIFSLVNDKLYVIHAQWGNPEVSYKKYDALTETVESERFITGNTKFASISALGIDPIGGDIYIADAGDFVSTGTLYIFSPEGTLKATEDTKGPDPGDILFHVQ
jgi:DNA-binding beta-propeller fold protein YncE